MSDLMFTEHPDGSWRIAKKDSVKPKKRRTLEQIHAGPGFTKYDGRYVKQYYDICYSDDKTGTIIRWCWPNAGTFHDQQGRVHPGEALYIRICEEQDITKHHD